MTSSRCDLRRSTVQGVSHGLRRAALGSLLTIGTFASSMIVPMWSLDAAAAPARPTRGAPAEDEDEDGDAPARPGEELSGDEGGAAGHNFCRKQPPGTRFKITLPEEAELKDLVNWMMSISCQKFIWDPGKRSTKVTILSPEPVTIEEAYAAFYAALQTMGMTVEPSGRYFKLVETGEAKSSSLPVYGPDGRAPANDRFVTQLVKIRSGNTKDVVELLNKLKTKSGSVEQVGDLVILTDTGTNVQRLMRILQQVDDPSSGDAERIFFFQLKYADPEETAATVRDIFGEVDKKGSASTQAKAAAAQRAAGAADATTFSRVVVDERTGTLIIVAPKNDYEVIRRLIERLDVPLVGGGGRIHVVTLRNADPEEVAQVLTQLGTGAKSGQQGATQRTARPGQPGGEGGTAELFSGEIKVTADPATRSLVILASTSDFAALERVIRQLDAPRRQVYIEVYLLELAVSKRIRGGAGGHFGRDIPTEAGTGLGFVSSAPGEQNSVILNPSVLSGLAAGVIGPQVPNSAALLGTQRDIPAFGVVIQALQNDSDVNFVAEPHIYTADNQEASIEVGRNVPTPGALAFPGGGQGGGLVPVQSVQRQDVTLNVKITPHVNDGSMVTLDIEMENNDIESIDRELGVTTTKRRLKLDKVVARDDQPVVLGGLMQEVERDSVSQVPGLGSIPLLGWLFKSREKQKEKVNLLMVLVPHILETPDDVRRIHARRMKERLEFIERYTAFKRRDLATAVNYRKKSGLLASINREARQMESEDEFRRQADLALQQQVITGELGLSPVFGSEEEAATDSSAAPTTGQQPTRRRRPQANPQN